MNSIEDFIQSAASQIGVSSDAAEQATDGLFKLIKDQAGKGDFESLTAKLPGGADVASRIKASGGGLVGGFTEALGGKLGAKLGGAASVLAIFEKSGLDLSQAGRFASMFFDFAKDKAGSSVVDQILGKMPDIKKLVDQ